MKTWLVSLVLPLILNMFINYVATSFPNDDDDLSNRKPSLLVYKEVNFRSSHSFNKKRLFQERGSFEMTAALNTHKLHQDLSPSLYKAKGKMITRTRKLSSPPFTKELPKRRPNSRPNRRPKRPLSAYNIFFRLCRRIGHAHNAKSVSITSKQWKCMKLPSTEQWTSLTRTC